MTEPKITISIELQSGIGITLTLAEAKVLRGQLNELLGTDEPIAQPISVPYVQPNPIPPMPPVIVTTTPISGKPIWRKTGGTTVTEMPEGVAWKSDDADCR